MIFKRKEFSPYPISDRVTFRNVDRVLHLTVKADGGQIVRNLRKSQEKLSAEADMNTEEERLEVARFFAASIFGPEQAQQIVDLYDGDSMAIVSVCGDYFSNRLSKIITKVQKKRGV